LEKELRNVRNFVKTNSINTDNDYCKCSGLPSELIYADDTDFITEDKYISELITQNIERILQKGNLKVNPNKTEQTIIERGNRLTEKWRGVKKLGSLLGDSGDMIRRKSLATAAFNNMKKVWIRNNKVHIRKRIKLYNTLVKPVLLYNSGTWGMTKNEENSINTFHRKHLRKLWRHNWRHRVCNIELYKMSNVGILSEEIRKSRWKLFGHILRLNGNTPAQKSMDFYFENYDRRKCFRGRPRMTLVTVLNKDIEDANAKNPELMTIRNLKCYNDLYELRGLAQDRKRWQKIVALVCKSG
jgi:hypothetical protein